MYEAIRLLSILKENPNSSESDVLKAQQHVEFLQENMGELSEMAQIRNLHWWTVEYGLIGTLETPRIYGAGLLSSIGESAWCMQEKVNKVTYSIEAATINFDITKPQPQLFVTPDFAYLSLVLEEFANTMAMRKGGLTGVQKLVNSKSLGTIELSTGIQVSGNFTTVIKHKNNKVAYFQTSGKTALSSRDKELIGHGVENHLDGFGSPIGKLKGINLQIEDMSPRDLKAYGIYEGEFISLEFESGVKVEGKAITGTRDLRGKILLISFIECTVTFEDQILFKPEWGIYDMAIGKEVVSAYSGAADHISFDDSSKVSETKTHKIVYSENEENLYKLYTQVKKYRDNGVFKEDGLLEIFRILKKNHSKDWLLPLEIYELALEKEYILTAEIYQYLQKLKENESVKNLIENGLKLIQSKNYQL
jgi:phenylalanine-4-hydroxylase